MKRLLFFLCIAQLCLAGFEYVSHQVVFIVNEDGTAHVEETMRFYMNDKASVDIYDAGIAITNDITSWKVRTNVSEVRHHVDKNIVDISNIIIRPQPKDTCNSYTKTCYGTLKMDYDIGPFEENGTVKEGTGLFFVDKYKPRTTNYTLNQRAFSFETTQTGEIVLPEDSLITIKVPSDSIVTFVDPLPSEMRGADFPLKGVSAFSWRGRTTLADFQFKFQREQPLRDEVLEFFASAEQTAKSFLFSLEGIVFLLIVCVASITYYLLKKG